MIVSFTRNEKVIVLYALCSARHYAILISPDLIVINALVFIMYLIINAIFLRYKIQDTRHKTQQVFFSNMSTLHSQGRQGGVQGVQTPPEIFRFFFEK